MSITQEELKQLKEECKTLNNKLQELSNDEIIEITGGFAYDPFEKLSGEKEQDINTPQHHQIDINGLEIIGPYATSSIPLDSDPKLKK